MARPVIAIVCGTRPEIIKLAPVYHALREAACVVEWIHTSQHEQMAEEMYQCFAIEPSTRLHRQGRSIGDFSSGCRMQLDAVMEATPFDMCLVQGDTESAFVGAVSAFYHRVPVGHVEAGLRTYNLAGPFPEEALRQMISRVAALHFAPTERAETALRLEGIDEDSVFTTGNTVVDAQQWAAVHHGIRRRMQGPGHILVTLHRREHWGEEMRGMFGAIAQIAREYPSLQLLFPVHLNPVVHGPAHALLEGLPNVRLVQPLDYVQMQQALADSLVVLTDSGGLQEEAPTYGVPVLVLRHETERPEAVEAGCAALIGPEPTRIVHEVRRLLSDELAIRRMKAGHNPFGDGRASERITRILDRHFSRAAAQAAA